MAKNSALILVLSVAGLLTVGIVMLFSTSAYAHGIHGDIYYFLKRQSAWLILGIIACLVAIFVDYRLLRKVWWLLFVVSAILLGLCFVHGIGSRINGSWRWIHFGPVSFQPSEGAKLAVILFIAYWYSRYEARTRQFWCGFIAPMVIASLLLALILREEDLGTTMLIVATMVTMMFVAGVNVFYMGIRAAAGVGGILLKAMHMHERMARLTAFMHPELYRDSVNLQAFEAAKAFGSGGISGLGLGDSREKMSYLPEAHTDFIFPIIGEELGLRITLLIVFAYLLITISGTLIATQSRDRFGMLLAFGITANLALQACVNIGMTTSLLPNKGMPLPFISSGGTNLCLCLFFVGILLNIYRQGIPAESGVVTNTAVLQSRSTPRL